MAIMVKRNQSEFSLHPEGGPFPAVISRVVLHPGVQTQYGPRDRLQITLQTRLKMQDHARGIDDDRPMSISLFANSTLNDGSRLLALVQQQIPRERLEQLLQQSEEGIDIEQFLVGSQWLIEVEHAEVNGKTYANVTSTRRAPDDQYLELWEEEKTASSSRTPRVAGGTEIGKDDDSIPF